MAAQPKADAITGINNPALKGLESPSFPTEDAEVPLPPDGRNALAGPDEGADEPDPEPEVEPEPERQAKPDDEDEDEPSEEEDELTLLSDRQRDKLRESFRGVRPKDLEALRNLDPATKRVLAAQERRHSRAEKARVREIHQARDRRVATEEAAKEAEAPAGTRRELEFDEETGRGFVTIPEAPAASSANAPTDAQQRAQTVVRAVTVLQNELIEEHGEERATDAIGRVGEAYQAVGDRAVELGIQARSGDEYLELLDEHGVLDDLTDEYGIKDPEAFVRDGLVTLAATAKGYAKRAYKAQRRQVEAMMGTMGDPEEAGEERGNGEDRNESEVPRPVRARPGRSRSARRSRDEGWKGELKDLEKRLQADALHFSRDDYARYKELQGRNDRS